MLLMLLFGFSSSRIRICAHKPLSVITAIFCVGSFAIVKCIG
jgi:hypothetical protein